MVVTTTEATWPETVVLDSTWFMVTNTWTDTSTKAFGLLGAYGYPSNGPGRTWALRAPPQGRAQNWTGLLTSMPGQPKMVVCGDDRSIVAAVEKVWPGTFIKFCEHHLRESVLRAMSPYGLDTYGSAAKVRLNSPFHNVTSWRAFERSVAGHGVGIDAWLDRHRDDLIDQARRRHLPQHHSTGAIEEVLATVREFMAPRAFCYCSAARTNRMLELVRARLNRNEGVEHYAATGRPTSNSTAAGSEPRDSSGTRPVTRACDEADSAGSPRCGPRSGGVDCRSADGPGTTHHDGSMMAEFSEPPRQVWFDLDEALELLAALEDVREELAGGQALTLLMQVEVQVAALHRKLDLDDGGPR